MNTPELPEPIFDNDEDLTPEIELPAEQEPVYNPLFENLVPQQPETRLAGRLSFADAMPQMGMSSVFDIIRQPKLEFTSRLRNLSDADGDLAYDNAMCYANQIARSFREEQVSSGRSLPLIAPQTGVRALVNVGPSYPNLFKENWDQFCKVGAIEAMDGPVAYLGSLRRFAAEKIEGASTSPLRIPLAVRRPDLDQMLIDEQSTYQSRPMLDLVNDVLTQGINKYQKEQDDVRPIHQLLAEKKHPFVFPYHFAHQQVSLALGGEKPALGALSYRVSVTGPGTGQPFGHVTTDAGAALTALSGLSPSLQKIVLAPSLFSHFYIGLRSLLGNASFFTPSGESFGALRKHMTAYLLPVQREVTSVEPTALTTIWASNDADTSASLAFSDAQGATKPLPLKLYVRDLPATSKRSMNQTVEHVNGFGKSLQIQYTGDEALLTEANGSRCDITITAQSWSVLEDWQPGPLRLAQWKFTFVPEDDYALTPEEQAFFRDHYGLELRSAAMNPMTALDGFLRATSLDSEQAEALLAVKAHAPIKSAHFINANRAANGTQHSKPFPLPNHYGACYVNGVGGSDPGTRGYRNYDNAMALVQEPASGKWSLTNTSLERFDRLQRMIRLQKVTGLPFAQLDTLITAAMRCEGDANANMEINANTLRALGAYRHFNEQYRVDAETFAAFMYHVSPYASSGKVPQLDAVFNTPVLFDTPLIIDNGAFSLDSADPAHQKTIAQLCASLNVQPGIEFERIAKATLTHVTPLRRSFAVLSSLYRQARIAQMFGLSVNDCCELTELLGGSAYRTLVASGRLKALESDGKDILDVLMELDWAVRWLKDNKLTVSKLRDMVDAGPVPVAAPSLLERLEQLAGDTRAQVVTADAVAALKLPVKTPGTAIDWFAELGKGAAPVIDKHGLVNAPALTVEDSDAEQLLAKVTALVTGQDLTDADEAAAITALNEFLLDALTQQNRLVEALLQEHTTLLPELAVLVGRCAEVSPQQLLVGVLKAWPDTGAASEAGIAAMLAQLHQVKACAKALSWVGIGAKALRTLLVNPAWLGAAKLWPLSLDNLRAFKAYDGLFDTLGQPEERLLGYLEQANALVSKRPGKRQLTVQAQTCNAALAALLGWRETEVALLTELLPQKIAKTVAHIDWLRRAQAVSLETGLNAAALLQACSLTADSPEADWQAVGQAAMAAVRA
nr:Tc toxin subunit A [uncultured Pseudomonas sp.]